MAAEGSDTEERIRRSVGRTLANALLLLISLGILGGWAYESFYILSEGQAAVVLRLGAFDRIEDRPGWHFRLPTPFEGHAIINVDELRNIRFGLDGDAAPGVETATFENAMQTSDSNIVNLSYELQYSAGDSYSFLYGLKKPGAVLRDSTQASVREVVGRSTIERVLNERASVRRDAAAILRHTLERYFEGTGHGVAFEIDDVELQIVQLPPPVQEAFDDVTAAQQDEKNLISKAQGDAREIIEQANGEAAEVREAAQAYKDSVVLESRGEAQRFSALLTEYRRAPEVTRQRLYLETMEQVMPGVEKMIVEPDTVNMLPVLSAPGGRRAPGPPLGGEAQ